MLSVLISVRSLRWTLNGAVLVVALLAVGLAEHGESRTATTEVGRKTAQPVAGTTPSAPSQLPELDLTRLRERSPVETRGDLFAARGWERLETSESQPPVLPPPREAPPLPFSFMGKLVDGGTTTVFLTNGERSYLARLGETIDGHYRVEEIGAHSITFAYLLLDARQSLSIGSMVLAGVGASPSEAQPEAALPAPLRASAAPTHDLGKLVWTAPSQVEPGEEFTIEVGLPAGPQARAGQVELVYDAMVLAVLGGATKQTASGATTQRAVVDVIGPGFVGGQPTPSEVRFRVLAGNPTNTEIVIENLSAVTADGNPLNLDSPSAHRLVIVKGTGTQK